MLFFDLFTLSQYQSDELVRMNAVEQIAGQIEPHGDYDVQLEAILSLTNVLTHDNEMAIDRCRVAGLNLRSKLNEILQQCEDKPECMEINEFSQILLERLFGDSTLGNSLKTKHKLVDDEQAER